MVPSKEFHAIVCPTYHPAHFLHGATDLEDTWRRDLRRFTTEGFEKYKKIDELLDWKEDTENYVLDSYDAAVAVLKQRSDMVREYELTDLALFTEARYTRHVTQADLHSALQDHPMSFEHFPSGSLYLPPQVSSQ